MISLIGLLFGLLAIIILVSGIFLEKKNRTWNKLVSLHGEIPPDLKEIKYKVQMVFFKQAKDSKYDYFNSMKVARRKEGVEFKPTLNHFLLKPLFLPYSELEKVGKKRLFILNRTVYKIRKSDLMIAI